MMLINDFRLKRVLMTSTVFMDNKDIKLVTHTHQFVCNVTSERKKGMFLKIFVVKVSTFQILFNSRGVIYSSTLNHSTHLQTLLREEFLIQFEGVPSRVLGFDLYLRIPLGLPERSSTLLSSRGFLFRPYHEVDNFTISYFSCSRILLDSFPSRKVFNLCTTE